MSFSCPECEFQTEWRFALTHHRKQHRLNTSTTRLFSCSTTLQRYKCQLCDSVEANCKVVLSQHWRQHSLKPTEVFKSVEFQLENEPLRCPNCRLKTFSKLILIKHSQVCQATHKNKSRTLRGVGGFKTEVDYRFSDQPRNDEKQFLEVRWFECAKCSFRSRTEDCLKQHLCAKFSKLSRKTRNGHTCKKCGYVARTHRILQNHNREEHLARKMKIFSCDQCRFKALSKIGFATHLRQKHGQTTKGGYACEKCQFVALTTSGLAKHVNLKHGPVQNGWLKCSYCSFKTVHKGVLNKHSLRSKHLMLKCLQCEFRTQNAIRLRKHVLEVHTDMEWFECNQCDYKVMNPELLEMHTCLRHPKTNQLSEDDLSTNVMQKNHDFVAEGWRQCVYCSFKTNSKVTLETHFLKVHNLLLKCPQCHFQPENGMIPRIHVFEDKSEIKLFGCDKCGFEETKGAVLETQMTEEGGITSYPESYESVDVWLRCSYCSFRTKDRRFLDNHVTKAHNLVLKCAECEFQTQTSMLLRKHVLEMHIEIQWFQCKQCCYKGRRTDLLEKHVLLKHRHTNAEDLTEFTRSVAEIKCEPC